jgi:phage-related protein
MGDAISGAGKGASGLTSQFGEFWEGARSNTRQIILITAAILAFGSAISVLSSGAVAALTALISSLAIGIIGLAAAGGAALVGLIWVISHVQGALEDMKSAFPPAVEGIENLKKSIAIDTHTFAQQWGPALANFTNALADVWRNDRMGEMAGKALGEVTDAFTAVIKSPAYQAFQTAMETTIPNSIANLGGGAAKLVEGLLQTFAVVGPFLEELTQKFEDWAAGWSQSIADATADGSLAKFFELAMQSVDSLVGAFSSLSGLLGTIFTAGADNGNRMLDTLAGLFSKADEFFKSFEGNKALEEWFANGEAIFGGLLDLIADLGEEFGALVTPATVGDMVNALKNLGDGLGFIFDIMNVLGGLDIFGNIIVAFQSLSALIGPLVEPLLTIATVIGDLIYAALQAVIPIFAALGTAVAPIFEAFAKAATTIGAVLLPVIEDLGAILGPLVEGILVPLGEIFATIVDIIAAFVVPIITVLIEIISDLIKELTPLITEQMPLFKQIAELVGVALQFLIPVVTFLAQVIGGILKVAFTVLIEIIKIAVQIVSGISNALTKVLGPAIDAVKTGLDNFSKFMKDVWKNIEKVFKDSINNIVNFFKPLKKIVDDAIGWFNSLFGAADDAGSKASSAGGQRGGGGGAFAAGGILLGPRRVLAGEGGPEAMVPLNRSLSRVDPSVRWLSAVAQGKSGMAAGGIVGGPSRTVNIQPGAITIQGPDARRAAIEVVNRIVEVSA